MLRIVKKLDNSSLYTPHCLMSVQSLLLSYNHNFSNFFMINRLAQYEKELTLRVVLEKYVDSDPEEFKVAERLWLQDDMIDSGSPTEQNQSEEPVSENFEPYENAISELKNVSTYDSPLAKLECVGKLVQSCRCIVHCGV